MNNAIPLVDLAAQYETIKPEIDAALFDIVERTQFVGGSVLKDFERAFASFCGAEFSVGVGSGTAAIHLALEAIGVGPGDEVIVPAHTFIATVEPIVWLGARPVFADICPDTYTIDPESVARCLTRRTKAIIPVHLYGQIADMPALRAVVGSRDIAIIEDAAQAHGATCKSGRAGSLADIACFSFYPGKNLGAYGDGGAVTTSNEALAEQISMLRDHGRADKYSHDRIGYNCRLDTIQAAVLSVKLQHLDGWNERRRNRAAWYDRILATLPDVKTPTIAAGNKSVYHLYVVEVEDRDALRHHLAEQGIASGIHYPIPLHRQPALQGVDIGADELPVTERIVDRILSLPMYAELTDDQAARVVDAVGTFHAAGVA